MAIAKNEGPYILEWIAYHLAIGFSQIVIYDNESTDDTADLLIRVTRRVEKVASVFWPSGRLHINDSPQTTAYNHAVASLWSDWVMFLDIDEFLVPFGDGSVQHFLARVPSEVGSVHVNWRGFGSSGVTTSDYGLVTTTFKRCAPAHWGNNSHFKSLGRTDLVKEVFIHNIVTTAGTRVLSDLQDFETYGNGMSNRIVHDAIQINHYQCKTYEEFRRRMNRGDANYHPSHYLKPRDDSLVRFGHLDENACEDSSIAMFHDRHWAVYQTLKNCL